MRRILGSVILFFVLVGGIVPFAGSVAHADHAAVEVRLVDPHGSPLPSRDGASVRLGPPLISPLEIAHARVHDTAVELELGRASAQALERVTATNKGRQLAIVVGGVVQATPTIRDRVTSGRVSITLRSPGEARKLAAALASP